MKVRCIDTYGAEWISVGTVYDVEDESGSDYLVKTDMNSKGKGVKRWFDKRGFVVGGEDYKVAITKDNLLKAYENGCSDVKKVLENLFPDEGLKTKKKIYIIVYQDCKGDIVYVDRGYSKENLKTAYRRFEILEIIEREY